MLATHTRMEARRPQRRLSDTQPQHRWSSGGMAIEEHGRGILESWLTVLIAERTRASGQHERGLFVTWEEIGRVCHPTCRQQCQFGSNPGEFWVHIFIGQLWRGSIVGRANAKK